MPITPTSAEVTDEMPNTLLLIYGFRTWRGTTLVLLGATIWIK
jgi:hypothetical protein